MYALTVEAGQCLSADDVCKTPSPSGPVPLAYPNIGLPPMSVGASTKVFVRGVPALNKASRMPLSSGDEPGVAGGVISSRQMGTVTFTQASTLVRIQGHPAVRLGDATRHNEGNAPGAAVQPSQCQLRIMR